MSERNIDASRLPDFAFGSRTLLGWGTWGFIAIEGCVFLVLALTAVYGIARNEHWPPPPSAPPPLVYATLTTALLLAAVYPNHRCKRAAERLELRPARRWLAVGLAGTAAVLVTRGLELNALEIRWDDHFFGSILWTTLVFHALHLLSNFVEGAVLFALAFRRGVRPHRLSDMADSASYAYFTALIWLPLYYLLFLHPRLG